MRNPRIRRWVLLGIFIGVFIWLVSNTELWETALRFLFPQESQVLHPRAPLLVLVGQHVRLVAISTSWIR